MGIEEDQVRRALGDLRKGFLSIPGPNHLVVVHAQEGLSEVQVLLLVVHHQNTQLALLG